MAGKLGLRAIGAVVLGLLTAIAAAGPAAPASAATPPWIHLCVDLGTGIGSDPNGSNDFCAFALGLNEVIEVEETVQGGFTAMNLTNWSFQFSDGSLSPFINGDTGMIKQANVNLCMQLDHADGDIVRGAACNGSAAEEWKDVFDTMNHRTWFQSVWATNNEHKSECLTWDNSGQDVFIDDCRSIAADDWGSS